MCETNARAAREFLSGCAGSLFVSFADTPEGGVFGVGGDDCYDLMSASGGEIVGVGV